MILSRELTEFEYGTYSQGLLVVNFLVPFLLLGLSNAVTYFSGQKKIDVCRYINNIVSIVFFLGTVGVAGILAFKNTICGYFGNPALADILPLLAFLPLLLNLISVYQTLFIAENMAVDIAVRNTIVSVVQIIIVAVSVFAFHDIRFIFILLTVMDFVQIVIFAAIFKKKKYTVRLYMIEKDIAKKIFAYSIPLALSTAIGTLSLYMDKLLIGNLMTVEDFALYTNMAKELPFPFVINSFTAVITPAFIKMHSGKRDAELKKYWAKYLELGICITWILCGTAVFCAEDLLIFLYSEKYAEGITIFVIYLLVDFCRCSYFGIILSAFGKPKIIMYSSLLSLGCNFVLNIVLFYLFGMVGPAMATFVSVFLMQMSQTVASFRLLKCGWREIFDIRFIIRLLTEILFVGGVTQYLGSFIKVHPFIRLIICGGIMAGILGLLNLKRIKELMNDFNSL